MKINEIIKNLLDRRKKTNGRYSMRALANSIGVSHSLLSQVIHKKKKISVNTAEKIRDRLGFDKESQGQLSQYISMLKEEKMQRCIHIRLKTNWRNSTITGHNVIEEVNFQDGILSIILKYKDTKSKTKSLRTIEAAMKLMEDKMLDINKPMENLINLEIEIEKDLMG